MSPCHCAVFASRGTAVGAEVCCLDIGLGHISRLHLSRCILSTGVRFIDFQYNSNLIVLSCFYMLYLQKTDKIIGFIGHAIMSNFALCVLNILIFKCLKYLLTIERFLVQMKCHLNIHFNRV